MQQGYACLSFPLSWAAEAESAAMAAMYHCTICIDMTISETWNYNAVEVYEEC
jgi:hypothetical protein